MHNKIIGYLLLVIGLGLMFFAFTGMYQTFVNKKPVVQVLETKPLAMNTQYGKVEVQADVVNQVLNLVLFALFMLFMAAIGGRVALAGNNLVKTERLCETLLLLKREDALNKANEIKKL